MPFDEAEHIAAQSLIDLALSEDLDETGDLTSRALIGEEQQAEVQVTARQAGIVAGMPIGRQVFAKLDPAVRWEPLLADASRIDPGDVLAVVSGPLRSLLTGERTVLNFLAHLSGVATLTGRFVDAVEGTSAHIYDTRKTLPGWRLLQKYAVRCGGGKNHRMGLHDGCLIKDNHLAGWLQSQGAAAKPSIAEAVRQVRQFTGETVPIEIEVDTLQQLTEALAAHPDVILLDNMDGETLRRAVDERNRRAPAVLLEASGGITLQNVAEIAAAGVDRISIGALTHSAPAVDLAFDWH